MDGNLLRCKRGLGANFYGTIVEVRNEEEEQREEEQEEEDSETEDPSWSPEETLKAYEEFGDDVDTDTKPR